MTADNKFKGPGGTPGGFGTFFIGLIMAVVGAWALTNQVTVSDGYFSTNTMIPFVGFQVHTFGLSLIPFLAGIACLFYDYKSIVGWILGVTGFAVIIMGILLTLHIQFRPTTLTNTLIMLVLLFGGVGMILRSLRPVKQTIAESTDRTPEDEQK